MLRFEDYNFLNQEDTLNLIEQKDLKLKTQSLLCKKIQIVKFGITFILKKNINKRFL